jgi:hypothetical protein
MLAPISNTARGDILNDLENTKLKNNSIRGNKSATRASGGNHIISKDQMRK